MKEYLNRKEYPNGDITVKLVKMGVDIDDTRNHRVRGIIKTEDNKYLFIEILQGNRISRKNLSLSSEDYLKKYPCKEYIFVDGCFRVDIPEDYNKNYSPEFSKYDRHSFYKMEYNKENIIKLLQKFNKNIKDIELVDDYYLDDYCNQKGFYKLYDDRLNHTLFPNQIKYKNNEKIIFNMTYSCTNYDNSVTYTENIDRSYEFDLEKLNKEFGTEKMKKLLDDYEKNKLSKHISSKNTFKFLYEVNLKEFKKSFESGDFTMLYFIKDYITPDLKELYHEVLEYNEIYGNGWTIQELFKMGKNDSYWKERAESFIKKYNVPKKDYDEYTKYFDKYCELRDELLDELGLFKYIDNDLSADKIPEHGFLEGEIITKPEDIQSGYSYTVARFGDFGHCVELHYNNGEATVEYGYKINHDYWENEIENVDWFKENMSEEDIINKLCKLFAEYYESQIFEDEKKDSFIEKEGELENEL